MSSQTMTAPALDPRPPDTGPGSSMYAYAGSHRRRSDSNTLRTSPPSEDSAVRAPLYDSAPDQSDDISQRRPSLSPPSSAAVKIKSEFDNGSAVAAAAANPNPGSAELDKQSAAGALLAQLLANPQGTAPSGPPAQSNSDGQFLDTVAAKDNRGTGANENNTNDVARVSSPKVKVEDSAPSGLGGSPEKIPSLGDAQLSQQNEGQDHMGDPTLLLQPGGHDDQTALFLPKISDPAAGLSDPLPSPDQAGPFPFDITAAPSNALEALKQHDILTATYLSSQCADLSALGYPAGLSNGASSIDGPEPRIQAFAKLEFDDGHFYVNTYSFILGRDVRAARAAHQRELRARQAMRSSGAQSSSGGNTSHTPNRARHDGSAIMGSVVSDRGGIMGFDPDVPPHLPPEFSRRSSNSSYGGSNAPLHATPAELQATDYNALAMQSLNNEDGSGDPKPVDTLALLPSPDACPTIPIHPPTTLEGSVAGHKGISRKHVKIAYNFDKNLFEMEVLGRNGAFIGADFLQPGQIRPLHSGDYIQIGGVRVRFLLPDVPIGETGADRLEESCLNEDENVPAEEEVKETADTPPKVTKIVLKTKEPDPNKPRPSVEGPSENGEQQPARRRGPGRPPKDGIMSKRERAELAREQKLAARREANGGVTPPPLLPPSSKPRVAKPVAEGETPLPKPEKRKYTKRKRPEEMSMDIPIPSTEGGQFPIVTQPHPEVPPPPVKKRKPSRSPSPNYPPESAYTPEDLAKPPYNYAVLIFDALTEAGTPMTLKQIYRALKLKYPYFRFKCETEGWTSSVRHNLNGNGHLFMHAERDGKGWSWQLRPGASVEKEKKRRPSPPPSQPPPSTAAASSHQPMPQMADRHMYANPPPAPMANQHFQFPAVPLNPYTAPGSVQQHSSPYPPPQNIPPLPSSLQNSLPPAFIPTPTTYTSPYASDPPPQLVQYQQSLSHQNQQQQQQQQHQQQQQQHHHHYHQPHPQQSSYPPQNMQPLPATNHQPHQMHPPNSSAPYPPPPPPPQNPLINSGVPGPVENQEMSFIDRANKAIDDFEAVLMEDYDDKNYIREVLKSARARALGEATASSFPGGEPKDEAVILDALRNLVGSLKDE